MVPPILFSCEIVLNFAFSLSLHMNCRIQLIHLALCRFFFLSPFWGVVGGDRVSTIAQAGIVAHHVRQAGLQTGGSPASDSEVLGTEGPVPSFFISCSAVPRVGPRASCVLSKCSPLNHIPSLLLCFILRQGFTRQSGLDSLWRLHKA